MANKQLASPAHIIEARALEASKSGATAEASNDAAKRKKDMRWQRTERHILRAFRDQLTERPLNKISVTQLAAESEINKATFYLHYADVYELAIAYARGRANEVVDDIDCLDKFFSDPRAFAQEFVNALAGEGRLEEGKIFVDNGLGSVFAYQLSMRMYEALEEKEPFLLPERAQEFVMFFVHGVMGLLPKYLETEPDQVVEVAAMAIEAMKAHSESPQPLA
jgi:AcrR family transcriptional regulator